MRRKLSSVVEFALVITFGATLTVHTVAAPGAPEMEGPTPSIEQVEAAVAAADAQAVAVNGRRR
ncbi:MAG TPA: hypothetical protein VF552_01110 [Allosphingosinicella sp.]|jgi:hypothetical protein